MYKPLLGLAIVLFLFIPVCYAEDIVVNVEPVKNRVSAGDWAIFDVSITNLEMNDDTFIISVKEEGVEWSVITESTVDYTSGIHLKPGETKTTRILLKDKGLAPNPSKPYSIQLDIISLENKYKSTAYLHVHILDEIPIIYESDIDVSLTIPRYMDPRNIYSFKISLYNNNKKDIKNLKINLDSALVKRDSTVQLEPLNRKIIDFTVSFDGETKPVIDTLIVTVTDGNQTLYRDTTPIEIVGYRMGFDQTNSTESSFLRDLTTITLTNTDNVEEQQKFMLKKRSWDSLFTSTAPDAVIIEKGGKYYSWDIKLEPNESQTLVIDTNYRPLLYVLIVILISAFIYLVFRDPVDILKNCDIITTSEGGINEIKIVLVVKNRTQHEIKNLRLVDMIPKLAHVEKKKEHGTLHPHRMVNTNKGVALEWNFDMEAKEERLVSYYIKSKLSILGGLRLPKAQAMFTKDNKKKKVKSNNIHIAGK